MLLVDVLIRYSAVALLLFFAVLFARDGKGSKPAFFAMLLVIATAALMLGTAPEELQLPYIVYAVTRFVDAPSVILVWFLGRSLFEDNFKIGPIEWAASIAYLIPTLAFRLVDIGAIADAPYVFHHIVDIISFGMMAQVIWVTLKGRSDDMVEARRKGRLYFSIGLAVGTLALILAENLFYGLYPESLSIFRAAVSLGLTVWGLLWLTKYQPELLNFEPAPIPVEAPQTTAIDPKDQALHARLTAMMEEDKIYGEQGLTIRILAEKLGAPEHRLRALINGGLGHRNFSAFLNRYRLAAAKTRLSDPDEARTPILTIAMDTGFGSLAPFNRAFKKEEGVTPTEYRAKALGDAVQS